MTTIARLSLAVPTTVKDRFATAFAKHLAPLLQKHGLIGVMIHNNRFPDGIFSRLYKMDTPQAVHAAARS